MTFKALIFGNSHIAALKMAHTRSPDRWTDIKFDFIGTHAESLLETRLEGTKLVPTSAEAKHGFENISDNPAPDLAHYDGVAIFGCQFAVSKMMPIYNQARWLGLPSLLNQDDIATMDEIMCSDAMARAWLGEILRTELAMSFAAKIRSAVHGEFTMIAQPRTNVEAVRNRSLKGGNLGQAIKNGDQHVLNDLFEKTARSVCSNLDMSYVPQPAKTIQYRLYTKPEYMRGAPMLRVELGKEQPTQDMIHANVDYGELVLDNYANKLRALVANRRGKAS